MLEMRVLVTGGAGFIGSNLAHELVRRGAEVTVLDDFSTGSLGNLSEILDKIRVIRASTNLISQMEGFEVIYHLGIPSSSPMYRQNRSLVGRVISEFIEVMESARKHGSKVIYASSSSVYKGCQRPFREDMELKRPFDYYTEARIAMERLAKVYYQLKSVESVGLRLFSVYGPRDGHKGEYANIITQMARSEEFEIYGDGNQTRDFTHVSDAVRAFILSLKLKGCEIVNVGTGRETSFNQIAELLGARVRYSENPIKNYVMRTQADLTKAKRILGYSPKVNIEKGIGKLKKD